MGWLDMMMQFCQKTLLFRSIGKDRMREGTGGHGSGFRHPRDNRVCVQVAGCGLQGCDAHGFSWAFDRSQKAGQLRIMRTGMMGGFLGQVQRGRAGEESREVEARALSRRRCGLD